MTTGCRKKLPLLAAFMVSALICSGMNAGAQGYKRTMLQSTPFPGTQYITALYAVDIEAGATIPKHTHPGLETVYVLEGEADFTIEGQPVKHLKPGDSAQIPMGTVHSATATAKPLKLLITYVVEKDKPFAPEVTTK